MYGHDRPTSPALDAFAERALVFEHAYSAAPWTKPSVASMLTSLYPPQHRVLDESTENQLASSLVTLPEVLQTAGYRTMAISENPHVQPQTGFEQGFERFERVRGFKSFKGHADKGAAKAISWLSEEPAASDVPGEPDAPGEAEPAPFFLYLHFLDPHGPYTPVGAHADLFTEGFPHEHDDQRLEKGKVGVMIDGERLTIDLDDQELAFLEALYDTEIREVDAAIGELFAFLTERDLWDDTVVLVTSDHGEEFLDHGSLRHGYRLYDESVHVPLMIAVPGTRPRRVADVLAQHVDLAPTVLAALGLDAPASFQGRDLLAALGSAGSQGDPPFVFLSTEWRDIERRAVREGRWKLIVHEDDGLRQLFDLDADPLERNDVLAQHPEVADRLLALYESRTAPIPGVTPEGTTGAVDEGLEEELRALGYMGTDE